MSEAPQNRREEMRLATIAFHRQHPEIWTLFCRFAWEKIRLGFANYSARAVMHRVRWETATTPGKVLFKINNNHITFYGRAFMRLHPEHEGFFRLRKQRSEFYPPKGGPDIPPPYSDPGDELGEADEWPKTA